MMLVCLILAAMASTCTCMTQSLGVEFERTSLINKIPSSGDIGNNVMSSVIGCAKTCSENSDCLSLFYVKGSKECQRHNTVFTNDSAGLIVKPSAVYFERTTGTTTSTTTSTSTSSQTTTAQTTTTTTPSTTTTMPVTTPTPTTTPTTTMPAPTTTTMPTTTTSDPPCVPTTFSCPPVDQTSFTQVILPNCTETFSFRFFNGSRDYYQAKTMCEGEGANLVEILTVPKMAYMLQLMACPDFVADGVWIDSLYNDATLRFETINGVPLPMTTDFWYPGQPNAPGPGICAMMFPPYVHLWGDYFCTYASPLSVCEIQ